MTEPTRISDERLAELLAFYGDPMTRASHPIYMALTELRERRAHRCPVMVEAPRERPFFGLDPGQDGWLSEIPERS